MPFILLCILALFQPLAGQQEIRDSAVQDAGDIYEIFYHLNEEDEKDLQRLSKQRLEILKAKNAEKEKEEGKGKILRVAILGNSALKYTEEGFNDEALRQLFTEMKRGEPEAVFFLGPLVIPGSKLDNFYDFVQKTLGDIPLYPTPDTPEIVEKFKLPVSVEFPQGYTVLLKNTLFALFSSEKNNLEQLQKWLAGVLQERSQAYRFVLGNTAAFSTRATEGAFEGLDQWPDFRGQFWDLLRSGDVKAYFASNEIVYDRTYRAGVWQILTGGAGANRTYEGYDNTFYHYLILSVPQDKSGAILEAFDIRGEKKDSWRVDSQMPAISQFRISVTNS